MKIKWEDIGYGSDDTEKYIASIGDRRYFCIELLHMHALTGDNSGEKYCSEVKYLDLKDLKESDIEKAKQEINYEDIPEIAIAEWCIQYGFAAPLDQFGGDKYPARILAQAKRCALEYIKDNNALEKALDKPCNGIGSTAREFMRGDLDSAMKRLVLDPTADALVGIIKQNIAKFAAKFASNAMKGKIPAPGPGDCWYCVMVDKDGKPIGGSDHLRSHIKESYLVPSLLVHAAKEMKNEWLTKRGLPILWASNCTEAERKQLLKNEGQYIYDNVYAAIYNYIAKRIS